MIETFIREFNQNSAIELIAVVLAITYLLLAVRENIACWYAAFVSTAIYFFIFMRVHLYMESALQIYYLAMAVYGWYEWKRGAGDEGVSISTWRPARHLQVVCTVIALSILTALALDRWTDARLPLLDSFTTWGAIVTTWMVARKILENWVYWLVIDSVSVYLYIDRSLYFTALLFIAYLVIVVFGWIEWHRTWRTQQAA
ncbi:MAG: nicotinamide mononucleotide transporter [Pseudomonadales bacterium]|nr:nicotinamide mononucleotide transporter [Pseudomonadales bacterium]